ncbi:MAG: 3-hydroxyacyl-CoA dehydrogenase [Sphingopyxis macrogoltabida]|uniref:3-hydroxyacyl-CoA dehydrogenase n=1 Tax=Sphingopyxis macrogoltabida TaxID=33050 RepID=A0A2W5N7W5_SPHMC|nr:MAG: 3-hydroxyacyl-CoA dehydrogenase [Sphingopyxis macrogoltabida]
MTSPVRTERKGEVLVIISDNPPVNALGAAVRQGLDAGLDEAQGDDAIKAVVIRCDGRTFFAGADITEFGKAPQKPNLLDVIERIEAFDKPVVAAIHGTALGGGCEIALGCHYRVAARSAKIGTPEVKLGLLPGGGGTQRLPRIAGVALALEMTAKGDPISASRAQDAGLVDKVVDDASLEAEAVAFAAAVADVRPLPRASERSAAPDPEAVAAFVRANGRRFKGFEAPAANIACVVKATETSFDEGIAFERAEFMKLLNGTQSAAQRHMFFAERQAAKIDDLPADTPLRKVERVGILGAGTMGGGIAMNFLTRGIPVTIVDTTQEALDRGISVIRSNYDRSVKSGRYTAEQVDGIMARLTGSLAMEDFADSDLVIEAVYENMDLKKQIFADLGRICKQGAILATNTSFLNVDEIAEASGRAADVVGMHFFSPANVMRLLEVVRGDKTAPDVLATVMALGKTIGKVAVVSRVCFGFIGNRIMAQRGAPCTEMLLDGATPAQIDKVFTDDVGLAMGPYQMSDMAGVDVGWHRDTSRIETIRDALCAEGRLGQKAKAGFYDYDDQRNRTPSDKVTAIIDAFREKAGRSKREVGDTEILERAIYPMINEGAKILSEGVAQRSSDIDVVWVTGYGWPVYTGGPMFWANTHGLDRIVDGLERHGVEVAPLLREKARAGESFA